MFKRQLLIFLIIFVRDSSCVIDRLYDRAREVQTFYLLLSETDLRNISSSAEIAENPSYLRLKGKIYEIYQQLNEEKSYMNSDLIPSLVNILKSNPLAIRSLDTISLYIESIDDEYRKFNDHVTRDQFEELTKSVFPNIVPNILMIQEIMTDLDRFLPNERSLVTAIVHTAWVKRDEICGTSQLLNELLIQLFRIVMIAEIKTQIMMGFSNKYVHVNTDHYYYSGTTGWTGMNSVAISEFQKYFASYVNILTENLEATENLYLRACDPHNGNWILNDNYFELEGTVRAMFFRYSLEECLSQTCENMEFEVWSKCHVTYYEHRDECSTIPTDCFSLGSMKACTTLKHPRRLLYINSKVLGILGNDSECLSDNSVLMDDKFHPRRISASCSCDCYGNSNKISFLTMESRVELNRVITGLRFIRQNNILFIQIKDGLLGANGFISETTNEWRPIPNITDPSQIHSIDRENGKFFLDDLRLPSEYVLTGIQFNKATRGVVTGFEIRIFGVTFNHTTGELRFQRKIRSSMPEDVEPQPLSFRPYNSVGTVLSHQPSSGTQKYIVLQRSFFTEDFGQSTLPLFDGVPVMTTPPSGLNGVGIFHKGLDDYAGFISLRVYGMKYKIYFNDFESAHIMNGKVILD